MPTYYCPDCAKAILYEATKPKTCPSCGKSFASAFTVPKSAAPVPLPPTPRVPDDDDDEEEIVARQVKPNRRARPLLPQRVEADAEAIDPDDVEDYSPREVRRRARQLAASTKWNIKVRDADEGSVKFRDWCNLPTE